MMRVILNPASRGGAGAAAREEIVRTLGRHPGGFDLVETSHALHATELARNAVADGISIIVAAGGDGTVHEVANGILQATEQNRESNVALGVVPVGTGNDFVKMIPGAGSRAESLRTLAAGHSERFDVGLAEWGAEREYFVNAMGTGIDVEVVRQIQRMSRGTGALVYLQGLLRALARYRAIPLRITADDEELTSDVLIVAVSNGKSIGGTFRMSPDARADDGRLDLCIVDTLPLLGQLALVPRVVAGTHESSRHVRTRRVRSVTLASQDGSSLFFQLDGELREPAGIGAVRVTIQEARLQIVTSHQELSKRA